VTGIQTRFFWPLSLLATCLTALCTLTAVSLFQQQATVAGMFRENVASRRVAVELEECLTDLIALEREQVEAVSALHTRVHTHLASIRDVADQPEEKELSARITVAFADYLHRWHALPPPSDPRHGVAVREATRHLEAEVLPPCTEFRLFNGRRLEAATEDHERVLRRLAWGLAGIGVVGALAGLVLGFGVARTLNRSIRRIQFRIRDAAGKLAHATLPEIVFTGEVGFDGLHEQIDRLTSRIEQVVQQLHEREHEVLRAEQLAAVGQLAAGVGHEIRNPLTSIKLLVQAGLEDAAVGLSAEDLEVIEGEIRRMEQSLQTFLNFARPPKPERRRVELVGLIHAVVGLVRGRTEKQRVTVHVDAPPDEIALVADGGQLQQVLVNLVLNALDAMPTGGTLSVLVRPDRHRVTIEVADTGPGIPKTMITRLFQPFASDKDTGLGLGLVISRRIVEDHGGTIDAGNRPGGGATFFVALPADDAPSER
jgi:two-component system, NtrC family, sensor histidine kinase HydH